jgi:arsenate reductase-like glutaredoxin family protein
MLGAYLTPLTEQVPSQRTTGRAAADLAAKEEQITDTEAEAEQRVEGRFRTGEGTGMDKADVQKHITNETKGWKNAPPIKVVETQNQLPKYLQEQIEKENVVNPKGVWDPRTQSVFLISSNLTNNHDATYTVLHEVIGHFGLQKILGSKFDKVMSDIYNSNKAVKDRADNKIANGMDKLVAVEEVLAEMAETATNPSLVQKVVNIIRQALRALGFNLDTFTNGEILQLLQDSRKFVTGTEGVPVGGNVKFGAVFNSDAPIFYSQLASMVAGAPKQFNLAPKEQWAAWIKSNAGKNQVKEEEIEYSGVLDFLNTTSGKISREDLLEFLNQEGVKVDTIIRDQYATNKELEALTLLRQEAIKERILLAKSLKNDLVLGKIKLNQLISEKSMTYALINSYIDPNIKVEDEFARGYIKRAVLYRDSSNWIVMQNEDFDTYSVYDNSKDLDEPAIAFVDEASNYKSKFLTADEAREALEEFKLDMQNKFPNGGVDIYDKYVDLNKQIGTLSNKIQDARQNIAPQYGEYTLGSEVSNNYAELILTLLPSKQRKEYKIVGYSSPVYGRVFKVVDAEGNTLADDIFTMQTAEEIKDGLDKDGITLYHHGHWANVNNPIVHVRVNEKIDDKGNRVLFVEELQSDWGQAYAANKEPTIEIIDKKDLETKEPYYSAYIDGTRVANASTAEQARADALEFWKNHIKDNVAKAPFVTDPRSYTALAIKRLLRYAADNGYDKISFISGAEAYKRFPKTQDGESTKKGMETHYDVRIPSVTKDIFKKLGINPNSRTEEITVRLPEDVYNLELISEDGNTNIEEKNIGASELDSFILDGYFKMYGSYPEFIKDYYDPVTQELFYKKGDRLRSNVKLQNAINRGMDLKEILTDFVTPSIKVKIEVEQISTTEPFFTIDLTPEATEKVKRGQPMFREGDNEFKMSDLPEGGTFVLKKGTEIFHGAHKAKAEEIKAGGRTLSAYMKVI